MQHDESGFDTPADDGLGDEEVVNFVQLGFDVSEGPTKADNGEDEPGVVAREAWDWDGAGTHQAKLSGWTNPLSWSDEGEGDERVLQRKIIDVDAKAEDAE